MIEAPLPAIARLADDGSELDLVARARAGDGQAFGLIIQRFNPRLFRIARGVLKEDAEAEDALQEAYVKAFTHLDGFRGEAGVFTWLTRITLNEAYGRLRRRRSTVDLDQLESDEAAGALVLAFPSGRTMDNPETETARAEARRLIERAVDGLPDDFRIVFVLRELDQLSTEETAEALDLAPNTVKTRLHRARRLLRRSLSVAMQASLPDAFDFQGDRCRRVTEAVLARLAAERPPAA